MTKEEEILVWVAKEMMRRKKYVGKSDMRLQIFKRFPELGLKEKTEMEKRIWPNWGKGCADK